MGKRKSGEELERIKKEYNVFDIYSWSKYNLYDTDMYGWFLRYILKLSGDRKDSIYGASGGEVHDLMEGFYLGEINKEDLVSMYEDKMFELDISGYKFDRNDEEKNDAIAEKYHYCNKHFLENFKPIQGENIGLEKFLLIKVGSFLFQGYSDFDHEEVRDGVNKAIITDFKTSTIYTGDKIKKERGQLLLYALGKMQEGWKVEDIIIRWLFTKYVSVRVPTKDSYRYRQISRHEIGSCLSASVRKELKKIQMFSQENIYEMINFMEEENKFHEMCPETIDIEVGEPQLTQKGELKKAYINKFKKYISSYPKYSEVEIETMIEEMVIINSLENMPKEIKEIFVIEDCYVEIDFTQEDIDELKDQIINRLVDMNKRISEYNRTKDDSVFFNEINKSNEYYFATLSEYSPKMHKPYKEYLDNKNMFKDDEDVEDDINDILLELGLDLD